MTTQNTIDMENNQTEMEAAPAEQILSPEAVEQPKKKDGKAFMDMLRVVNKNHYTLNQMVDRKARILLSVNALILSLIIGKFITNHEMHDSKFFILVFFGLSSLIAMIFSMMAIMPEKTHGQLTEESIKNKEGNPLFFGNFKNMSVEAYENTMLSMKHDEDFIHRSMIKDTYHLGQTLEKKRIYLRNSLRIFVIGLFISLILAYLLRIFLIPGL